LEESYLRLIEYMYAACIFSVDSNFEVAEISLKLNLWDIVLVDEDDVFLEDIEVSQVK